MSVAPLTKIIGEWIHVTRIQEAGSIRKQRRIWKSLSLDAITDRAAIVEIPVGQFEIGEKSLWPEVVDPEDITALPVTLGNITVGALKTKIFPQVRLETPVVVEWSGGRMPSRELQKLMLRSLQRQYILLKPVEARFQSASGRYREDSFEFLRLTAFNLGKFALNRR